MKTRIKSVKGLRIGDLFTCEGMNFIVTSFPTRYSVCGKNQIRESGEPNNIKISLSQCNWINHKTGVFRV